LHKHLTKADAAHDLSHTQRVVQTAKYLTQQEGARPEIVIPAAWLHDCLQIPKDHPDRSQASAKSAQRACEFLRQCRYPSILLEPIAHAIEAHSFSAEMIPRTLEAQIVQDADRLDALGAIGIARVFSTSAVLQRILYDPEDPFAERREADDARFTLDHFAIKLLRIADTLHTETARQEGQRRKQFMLAYLQQLAAEIGERPPSADLPGNRTLRNYP
jgi:uncharacterized protein